MSNSKKSKNLITNEIIDIPKDLDDSQEIKNFLSINKDKKVVVVQGLGFVGAVMSLVCANALDEEYAVIGIDLPSEDSYWKIKSINDGIFPLLAEDPKINSFYSKAKQKGNLYATYDPIAYRYADVIIVDINLDVEKKSSDDFSLKNFDVNLNSFKNAIKSIGKNCKEDVLVIVETTVPPGTCKKVVQPILEHELKKRDLSLALYSLGHSYERVMPGPEYIDSIREYPRVYSGINEESAKNVEEFLKTIIDINKCELTKLKHTNATEMAKVLENSYRATNIAFAVEWSRYAEEAGVDLYSIVNAIRVRNTHSNLMYPGIGVGGYCLTKDPLLASWSRTSLFEAKNHLDMSIQSVSINDQMPRYAFNRLIDIFGDLKSKSILFLGVSYRGDVGDSRFSPVEGLYKLTKNTGAFIKLHDPFISHWYEQDISLENDLDSVLKTEFDLIIISTGHSLYKEDNTIDKIMALDSLKIYDTIGLFSNKQIKTLSKKHDISVLGRGDL